MEQDRIHLAFGLDDKFVIPASIVLHSLFETNKMNKFFIHVFSANLNQKNIIMVRNISEKYGAEFRFYHLPSDIFEGLVINDRISYASYYRLIVPNVIKETKRVIYLDADVLIDGDIKPLWETDLGDKVFGAVEDVVAIDTCETDRLNIPVEFGYFNAGVLVVDNEKWRKNNLTEKSFEMLKETIDSNHFFDQDGLNSVAYDKRKKMSPIWNWQVGIYYCEPGVLYSVFPELQNNGKNKPVIIHFNGREKPWHYVSVHPYADKFRSYFLLSGIETFPEEISIKKMLKRQAYNLIGWKRLNRYKYLKQKKLLLDAEKN